MTVISHSSSSRNVAETRLPPQPIVALFVFPGLALIFVADYVSNGQNLLRTALALVLTGALLWLLDTWRPAIGRWASVLALAMAILAVRQWLGFAPALAFAALPALLAAATMGASAAIVVVAVQSAALVALLLIQPGKIPAAEAAVALLGTWVALGALYWLCHANSDLAETTWQHYEHAQTLLEAARDRQSELKDALAALAHANRELALANERIAALRLVAEEARKSKAAFVANVSHELRTPLNVIIGLADLLLRPPDLGGQELPPNVHEDLTILYRNCEHLSGMISDVLDLSQVEAGRLAIHREWVDLAELAQGAIEIVRPLMDRKGLSLTTVLPANLPRVYCDPRRIRQVMLNLLGNAARYTDQGGVSIVGRVEGLSVVICVADTGPGISPQDAERIFEPFQQGIADPVHRRGGSGLGLSISKQFIDLHEGHIWLDTRLGSGSTFAFSLPMSPQAGPAAPAYRWITEGWSARAARVHLPPAPFESRVVLCDPGGESYPLLARFANDVEMIETHSPGEAVSAAHLASAQAILATAPAAADLVALVEQILAARPEAPVTGCVLPPRPDRALPDGAQGYLVKPILRADLARAMAAVGRSARRVLIADDDPDALHTLAQMVSADCPECEVLFAADGQEALRRLRDDRPDLVLLDAVMPGLDGREVLQARLADEALRAVPAILVTACDPRDEPLTSRLVLGTAAEGLSINKLLRCSAALTACLSQPD